MPQTLVNLTARQIAAGELDFVVLAGGESARTRSSVKDASSLPWPAIDDAPPATHVVEDLALLNEEEQRLGIVLPVQIYPMFESALRGTAGRDIASHERHIAELWARFSEVASRNEYAWSRESLSADDVLRVTANNRMIGLPYRKVMNSNNQVNLGAALIMCSAERATALGIPRDRWVFPHSGTDCHEHQFVSERWSFAETPAVARGGALALKLAGIGIDDVSLIDLYSCFPSAVQLGAASLGLGLDRSLTLTGGLSFAGGPWNNYVMHAIATAVRRLREAPGEKALVWANGGYATKHAFGIYAMTPPNSGFRHASPQSDIDVLPRRQLALGDDAAGSATIEAYTVMHDRDGSPERLIASGIRPDSRRVWISSTDHSVADSFVRGEHVGDRVKLRRSGELAD
jgi:acetyl-CoA C-acetyltransferase